MKLQEQVQEFFCPLRVEVEGAVKHTDILDAMLVDSLQSFSDFLHGERADRLLASAHAEGASVEASASGLQLYEGLAPIEETALFGRRQSVELHGSCQAIVLIAVLGIQVA